MSKNTPAEGILVLIDINGIKCIRCIKKCIFNIICGNGYTVYFYNDKYGSPHDWSDCTIVEIDQLPLFDGLEDSLDPEKFQKAMNLGLSHCELAL